MRRYGLRFSRLRAIFISHLHGDHCLGLPGLLSTFALHGREGSIDVYLPREGVDQMRTIVEMFCHDESLKINFIGVDPGQTVLDTPSLTVDAFALYHRVPCVGYVFREKPSPRTLRGDMADFYGIPVWQRRAIKDGADFVKADGTVVENSRLTLEAPAPRSYAYASDTAFDVRVAEAVRGVDVLYHESTYDDALEGQAAERWHSTARQAGRIARMAGVRELLLGHYSQRYADVELLLHQALEEFDNVRAVNEGDVIRII